MDTENRELVKHIISSILEQSTNNGDAVTIDISDLTSHVTTMDAKSIIHLLLSHKKHFRILEKDLKVELIIKVGLCARHCSDGVCNDASCSEFHVCKFFALSDKCERSDLLCKFGHEFVDGGHNEKLLKNLLLDQCNTEKLRLLFRLNTNRCRLSIPRICYYYNQICGCNKGQDCTYLHICQYYVQGWCKFNNNCKRSHDNQSVWTTLERYGIMPRSTVTDILPTLTSLYNNIELIDELGKRTDVRECLQSNNHQTFNQDRDISGDFCQGQPGGFNQVIVPHEGFNQAKATPGGFVQGSPGGVNQGILPQKGFNQSYDTPGSFCQGPPGGFNQGIAPQQGFNQSWDTPGGFYQARGPPEGFYQCPSGRFYQGPSGGFYQGSPGFNQVTVPQEGFNQARGIPGGLNQIIFPNFTLTHEFSTGRILERSTYDNTVVSTHNEGHTIYDKIHNSSRQISPNHETIRSTNDGGNIIYSKRRSSSRTRNRTHETIRSTHDEGHNIYSKRRSSSRTRSRTHETRRSTHDEGHNIYSKRRCSSRQISPNHETRRSTNDGGNIIYSKIRSSSRTRSRTHETRRSTHDEGHNIYSKRRNSSRTRSRTRKTRRSTHDTGPTIHGKRRSSSEQIGPTHETRHTFHGIIRSSTTISPIHERRRSHDEGRIIDSKKRITSRQISPTHETRRLTQDEGHNIYSKRRSSPRTRSLTHETRRATHDKGHTIYGKIRSTSKQINPTHEIGQSAYDGDNVYGKIRSSSRQISRTNETRRSVHTQGNTNYGNRRCTLEQLCLTDEDQSIDDKKRFSVDIERKLGDIRSAGVQVNRANILDSCDFKSTRPRMSGEGDLRTTLTNRKLKCSNTRTPNFFTRALNKARRSYVLTRAFSKKSINVKLCTSVLRERITTCGNDIFSRATNDTKGSDIRLVSVVQTLGGTANRPISPNMESYGCGEGPTPPRNGTSSTEKGLESPIIEPASFNSNMGPSGFGQGPPSRNGIFSSDCRTAATEKGLESPSIEPTSPYSSIGPTCSGEGNEPRSNIN